MCVFVFLDKKALLLCLLTFVACVFIMNRTVRLDGFVVVVVDTQPVYVSIRMMEKHENHVTVNQILGVHFC